jgi:hypothetical protein
MSMMESPENNKGRKSTFGEKIKVVTLALEVVKGISDNWNDVMEVRLRVALRLNRFSNPDLFDDLIIAEIKRLGGLTIWLDGSKKHRYSPDSLGDVFWYSLNLTEEEQARILRKREQPYQALTEKQVLEIITPSVVRPEPRQLTSETVRRARPELVPPHSTQKVIVEAASVEVKRSNSRPNRNNRPLLNQYIKFRSEGLTHIAAIAATLEATSRFFSDEEKKIRELAIKRVVKKWLADGADRDWKLIKF